MIRDGTRSKFERLSQIKPFESVSFHFTMHDAQVCTKAFVCKFFSQWAQREFSRRYVESCLIEKPRRCSVVGGCGLLFDPRG